jgi:single-strand DNA-binding protein
MNKVILIGRLTRDNELRKTQSGVSIVSNTIAVNRFNKNNEVDFIPFTVLNKTAEILDKYTHKGDKIALIGQIQIRSYEDKQGVKRTFTEVFGESVELLEKKEEKKETSPIIVDPFASRRETEENISDDDLPF